jgi:hypothetical protein
MRRLLAFCLLFILILSGCGSDSTATKEFDLAPLSQIIVTSENPFIANKTSNQFAAEGNFSNLFTQDISAEVVWTSSDPGVATIDANGLATAVTPGTTQITATQDGVFDFFFLTVTDATLSRIDIAPVAPAVARGLTQQFTAQGTFSDASEQSLTNSVTWSSVNTSIAAIDQTGLATALLEGTTNITAAFDGVTRTTQLTVVAAALTAIEITQTLSEVPQQVNVKHIATGTFSDGTSSDITAQANWSSSDESIATVAASGIAVGSAAGSVTITAAMNALSSSVTLNVTEAFLVEINITPAAPTVAADNTLQLTAIGVFNNNATADITTADITAHALWTTSDGSIATISNITGSEGLATGSNAGTTTVSATSGTITGTTVLTVN